jgi:hypothetical protein
MCTKVFSSQRGLRLHYHHAKNLFCNPNPHYQTTAEEASISFDLPPLPPNEDTGEVDSQQEPDGEEPEYDDLSIPVWSDGASVDFDSQTVEDDITLNGVSVPGSSGSDGMKVFASQRGLGLHYHNTNNLFCNPNPHYQTTAEEAIRFELPPLPPIEDAEEVDFEQELDGEDPEYDDLTILVF